MSKQIIDKSSIIIPAGTMEDFKRPGHDDFATTSELKAKEFSGIRHNSISEDCEIWLLGEVKERISPADMELNMHAIDDAVARVFALEEVRPYDANLIAYKHKHKKKE